MKTTLSLACIALIGAQAINVNQSTGADTQPTAGQEPLTADPQAPGDIPEEGAEEELVLTTYIGFEYEGAELAEMFSLLTPFEQNEIREGVEVLIKDYFEEALEDISLEDRIAMVEGLQKEQQ